MTPRAIAATVLLVVGVGVELACCVGVLVMRDVYDKLHYTAPATTLGAFAIAGAVLLRESIVQFGIKTILVTTVLLVAVLLLVAAGGTAVVLTRDPLNQAIMASFFGLLLGLAFLVMQAPDVALSQITVGAVALPLMILLALAKVRRGSR